jgi:hypothetical protein
MVWRGWPRFYPVGIASSRIGRFSSAHVVAPNGWCFRWFLVARAVRITEVNFHVRGYREGFVFSDLQSATDLWVYQDALSTRCAT